MGYELTRFVDEIDEEFHCSICKMVLTNPVQTPCDHLFCSQCINEWLPIKRSCAVDGKPLTNTDLKPISRTIQNLLSKLKIKCDFHSKGCDAVVKLEFLQKHLTTCAYNLAAQIVCDKGCNLEMSRREYQEGNCYTHFTIRLSREMSNEKEHFDRVVNRQEEEIKKLSHEVNRLRGEQDRVVNRQEAEIKKLSHEVNRLRGEQDRVVNRQEAEIKKLSDEVNRLRGQQDRIEVSIQHHKEEFTKLSDKCKPPLKWLARKNVKFFSDQSDILQCIDADQWGFVQSSYALEPRYSSFKIQVLGAERIDMKLSLQGTQNCASDKFLAMYSAFYNKLFIEDVMKYRGSEYKIKIGDIIELGIKFPLDFVNDGNTNVKLYVSINEQVETEQVIKMPSSPIYPLVAIWHKDTKVKYLG